MDGKRWEQATTQIYTQRAGGRPIRISDLFRISDFGLRILAGLGVTNLNRDLTAKVQLPSSTRDTLSPQGERVDVRVRRLVRRPTPSTFFYSSSVPRRH